jgi:hypothetical protein
MQAPHQEKMMDELRIRVRELEQIAELAGKLSIAVGSRVACCSNLEPETHCSTGR